MSHEPPLTLYIHTPWCERKCPYCDFNSHKSPQQIPEQRYVDALLEDLSLDLKISPHKSLKSIFIGGGTPSLLSASAYQRLFEGIKQHFSLDGVEITLEANPGSIEQQRFKDYRQSGINRLSIGIQSFNDTHLTRLGRIHNAATAHKAIETARLAGFTNLNLDIMHGLPNQSLEQGLADLKAAITHEPCHLSWYQLTIEPNTVFYSKRPVLPNDDALWELECRGFELLADAGLARYEISAFSKPQKACQHNLNYWQFGDYLGIGAGAHGKISGSQGIMRTQKMRQPKDYLDESKPFLCQSHVLTEQELCFEFMLNASRLEHPVSHTLFSTRCRVSLDKLWPKLTLAQDKGLIDLNPQEFQVTSLGRRFTNELQTLFLPD